jgi:hypothetical protein
LSRISDYDWRLDEIIAKHPNVSPETLARIGKKNLSHSALEARYNVAGHPNTPVDVLEKLSTDWFANVRIAVISNKHTPKSVLQKMGENDKSKDIRKLAEEELSRREK